MTLLEKAYAQANEIGEFARKTSRNTYTSIESGLNEAIKHISGSSSAYVYAPRMSAGTWNSKKSEIISKVKTISRYSLDATKTPMIYMEGKCLSLDTHSRSLVTITQPISLSFGTHGVRVVLVM